MSTDKKTTEVVSYEVTPRIMVDVPVSVLEETHGIEDVSDLGTREVLDCIMEDTDRIHDALDAMLERGDFTTSYVDVEVWQEQHEVDEIEPVRFYKPSEGAYYTLPIPSMISGLVNFTDNGIEDVAESPVNNLSDDQLDGAYFAAKRIWSLRGMHRYQQEQMAEFLSELQWGMLARPTLHVFKPYDFEGDVIIGHTEEQRSEVDGELLVASEPIIEHRSPDSTVCLYCGGPEEGHMVREPREAPTCGDEFDGMKCALPPQHGGMHAFEDEVGLHEWSDPQDGPPSDEEE